MYASVSIRQRMWVKRNKGAGSVDGMELDELDEYIRENWSGITEQIRQRKYRHQPVKRVEIPKNDGSKRKLGIPTVMDRVIQQGIAQVISPMCEMQFSESSYGFRPNRSCEMTIKELLIFLNEGYEWIVDIDAHLRTRLRVIIWKQWKVPSKRQWGLQKLGIGKDRVRQTCWGKKIVQSEYVNSGCTIYIDSGTLVREI